MEFSEDENIEIFNKTQRFSINKYENQIIRIVDTKAESGMSTEISLYSACINIKFR